MIEFYTICMILSAVIFGFCLEREFTYFKRWQEWRRIQTKSHLRIATGGIVVGRPK